MRVHVIRDEGLGNSSYLLEMDGGLAVSIDPRRDIEEHLALGRRLGSRIVASVETHLHADFVSGSRELAAATGAEVIAAAEAKLVFPHRGVADGDVVRHGPLELRAIETPGHTPEHLSFLAAVDGVRTAVFTGGSLIFGGAGRTDLTGPARTEELARAQYRSLRRLAELPPATKVHPTHGAGSFCSTLPGVVAASTIGDEPRSNPLFGIHDEDEFVRALLEGAGSFPVYFAHLRDVNRRPSLIRDLDAPRPLSPADAHELVERGAWLVDGRPVHDWAAAHPVGAVSIEVRPAFASWLGWVVPFASRVVLLVGDEARDEALGQAKRIGYDRVAGWIDGGLDGWRASGLPVDSVEEVDPQEARRRGERGAMLLDVRQDDELRVIRLSGATHIELGDIIAGKTPAGREAVTFCGHGERSATAASLLEARGVRVANLKGGLAAWEAAGLPVER